MANRNEAVPENVPGPFYVDNSCVDCDFCRSVAPQVFRRDDVKGYTYVHRQPVTEEEFDQAEEGRQGCPTESIGRDDDLFRGAPEAGEPDAPHCHRSK